MNKSNEAPNADTKDERWPMSGQEYYALKAIVGSISTLLNEQNQLKSRLKRIKGGWRDLKLIEAKEITLYEAILDTVPLRKLQQMEVELRNADVEIKLVRDVTGKHKPTFTYVPTEALEWLEEQVTDANCMLCEKSEKESRRCPIRRNIEALYAYDVPTHKSCPLARMAIE